MAIYTRMAVDATTSITTLIVFLMGKKEIKKKQLFVIVILEIQFLKVSRQLFMAKLNLPFLRCSHGSQGIGLKNTSK